MSSQVKSKSSPSPVKSSQDRAPIHGQSGSGGVVICLELGQAICYRRVPVLSRVRTVVLDCGRENVLLVRIVLRADVPASKTPDGEGEGAGAGEGVGEGS